MRTRQPCFGWRTGCCRCLRFQHARHVRRCRLGARLDAFGHELLVEHAHDLAAAAHDEFLRDGMNSDEFAEHTFRHEFFLAVVEAEIDRWQLGSSAETESRDLAVVVDFDWLEGGIALDGIGVVARARRFVARQNAINFLRAVVQPT